MGTKNDWNVNESSLAPGYSLGGWVPRAISGPHLADVTAFDRQLVGYSPSEAIDPRVRWMHTALLTSMSGVGLPSPNPNVGCVLEKDGTILALGATEKYGHLHGEAQALARLGDGTAARGATAYVTLEPCAHHGKQPPCALALVRAGIKRCIYAVRDPNPLVAGRGLAILQNSGVFVEQGPLRSEAMAWNLPFFAELELKRPLIVGKWAQTLNGQMADQSGGSQWITGPLARRYTHWLRQKYDAIMVGAGTVLADGPELSARDSWGPMRQPLKIIFDPSGRLARQSAADLPSKVKTRTFAAKTKVVLVCPTWVRDQDWAKSLDADIYYVEVKQREDAFTDLLAAVASTDFVAWYGSSLQSIFVEGGPALHDYLLAKDFYDAFHVFVTPSFISATVNRIGLFAGQEIPQGYSHIASMKRYKLLQSMSLGADVLMEFMPEDRFVRFFS